MYGDFSRLTFDRDNGYTAVWSQQGRVQLDADANEQTAILLDWMRTLATDFIGPAGGHIERAGFKVSVNDTGDLVLSPGHYYVNGIRCEVPTVDSSGAPAVTTYSSLESAELSDIPKNSPYLVYVKVWESTVNQLLAPALLEPALGPTSPDTTIRSKVNWAIDFIAKPPDVVPPDTLAGVVADQFAQKNSPNVLLPGLRARVTEAGSDADPDESGTIAGYSGLENQLYRIEIHRGSDDPKGPTFKWSRDNGSVEFGFTKFEVVDQKANGIKVELAGVPLPGRPRLAVGDCVEVIDKSWRPFGTPGPLFTVMGVSSPDGDVQTHDASTQPRSPAGLLRRWDSVPENGDGAPATLAKDLTDDWIPIEKGIGIRFTAVNDAVFTRGDYWVIPARAATSAIYGPTAAAEGDGSPPFGPHRHLAPLAHVDGKDVIDLRNLFTHLAWPDSPGGPP